MTLIIRYREPKTTVQVEITLAYGVTIAAAQAMTAGLRAAGYTDVSLTCVTTTKVQL